MKTKNKRKILNASIAILLITSFITAFASPAVSDEYDTQDTHSGCLVPSSTAVEVGDDFYVVLYIDSGGDSVTGFTLRELRWNETVGPATLEGLVNVTQQDYTDGGEGTPGKNLNLTFNATSSPGTWFDWTFNYDGRLHNQTGNLTYVLSSDLGGISGNNSAVKINFTALHPGTVYINIPYNHYSGNKGLEIGAGDADWWINATVNIHPQNATTLNVATWNHTALNISWTENAQGDNVTLCGKEGSYPTGPTDNLLYNGSNLTYNWTGRTPCTKYYFRAWSYNESSGTHSITPLSETGMTQCYTNISFVGVNPANESTTANCTYNIAVNVTIENSKARTCSYWINGSDGTSTSGSATNESVGTTMSGLNHNTTYWWNVTAAEQAAGEDNHTACYEFTTGNGGGANPLGSFPGPANSATSVTPYGPTFNVTVTDTDGDRLNVTFYWGNGTIIGEDTMLASGDSATTTHTAYGLPLNTTLTWYTYVNDSSGCDTIRYPSSGTFSFTTDEPRASVTKEWCVASNNTIREWINITNTGELNLTNGYVNNSFDLGLLDLVGSNPANETDDFGRYNITWFNTTGAGKYFNISLWLNLTGPVPNGTTFSDTASVIFNGTTIASKTPSTVPTMCWYATKEMNASTIHWNDTSVLFWINITNCGDFYLNSIQLNETYDDNLTYVSSNYAPNMTNETFNISQIAPGGTNMTWIVMQTTYGAGGDLVNGTKVWNNVTIKANETSAEVTSNNYWYAGARTTQVKIIYTTIYYDMIGLSGNVFNILGIVLIIGAIMLVIGTVYFYRREQW